MSMEWARARVLEDEVRLRDRVLAAAGNRWLEFAMTYPTQLNLWLKASDGPSHVESDGFDGDECSDR
jgi:hypothetical protein